LPGTHRTVHINPREFKNTVLAPPAHQEPQNQVFFAVIGAVVIIVLGAVVSNNNSIVTIVDHRFLPATSIFLIFGSVYGQF
jgi:hypothetical protein